MEDNRNIETQNEEQDVQEAKTFTQEEVDEIVRKRLARERKRSEAGDITEPARDREKELDARELRIMAREKLQDAGMPMALADVLRYSDDKSLEKAMETIKSLNPAGSRSWGYRPSNGKAVTADPVRKAMGLDRG